jgi:hypothetical protein
MIAGHVHSYERFERGGKMFLIAGGGGGPRVRLAAGGRRRHTDELFDGPSMRFFHNLLVTLRDDGLCVEVWGLEKHGDDVATKDRFLLRWPETARRVGFDARRK